MPRGMSTWYRTKNRNPVSDCISCCCFCICVIVVVLVAMFIAGCTFVAQKGSEQLLSAYNEYVTDWTTTYESSLETSTSTYRLLYDSLDFGLPVTTAADPAPQDETAETYTTTYLKTSGVITFDSRSWPSSSTVDLHKSFYLTKDGASFTGIGGQNIDVITKTRTRFTVSGEHSSDRRANCENVYPNAHYDYTDDVCEQKWGLASLCVLVNPDTMKYDNVGGSSTGNYGCFKGKSTYKDTSYTSLHPVPFTTANYWVGTYKTFSWYSSSGASGTVSVRSSHDPYVMFYKLNRGSMALGMSRASNIAVGIGLIASSCALMCCPFIVAIAIIVCIVAMCAKKNEGYNDDMVTTTTTTTVPQGQMTQPFLQQPQLQQQPMMMGQPQQQPGMMMGQPQPQGMMMGQPQPQGMMMGQPQQPGMMMGQPGMMMGQQQPSYPMAM